MPKDFTQILSDPSKQAEFEAPKESKDPNLFLNTAAKNEIKSRHNYLHVLNLISTGLLSLLTAPLVTTQITLQLSVLLHKNKYGDSQEQELKALMKLSKEITVQDRRKYELLIKSGVTGSNKPFRAPVYTSYKEVFQGLANQGILGFYKGNMIGFINIWLNSYLRFNAFDMLDFENFAFYHKWHPLLKSFVVAGICSVIDIICHPLQAMQSRFILQNRLPNFHVYKSIYHFFKKHYRNPREIMQGWKAHIPRNILMTFCWINFLKDRPFEGFIISTLLSHTLCYPLTTVIRRLQCQSSMPGMIPLRYAGAWHCLKLIFKEEGIKGLFRGFFSYVIVNGFTSAILIQMNTKADQAYDTKFQ